MTLDEYKNEIVDCLRTRGLTDEQIVTVLKAEDIVYGWDNDFSVETIVEAILM